MSRAATSPLDLPPGSHCLPVGHRGIPALAPENTLAAFREALTAGAEMIELDIQRTRDGELVVIHDTSIDRTTDGKGRIRELTLAEIRSHDAGSWFSPAFAGEKVPTLAEVIDLERGRAVLNIELKSSFLIEPGFEEALLDCLRRENFLDQVIISSFDHFSLRLVKELNPKVRTGALYMALTGIAVDMARWARSDALHPYYLFVTPDLVREAHQAGLKVYTWTVDSPEAAKYLLKAGVDGIMSNRAEILEILRAGY